MAGRTSNTASVAIESPRTGLLAFLRDFHNKTILFRFGHWIFVTYGMIAGLAFLVGVSTAVWYMGMVGSDPAQLAPFYLFSGWQQQVINGHMLPTTFIGTLSRVIR